MLIDTGHFPGISLVVCESDSAHGLRRFAMTGRTATVVVTFVALFVSSGVAFAQDSVGGISSELERTATTTAAEKAAYADSATAEISEAVSTMKGLKETAGKDGDDDAEDCITPLHARADRLKPVSQKASADMKGAIANGDNERADHEFRKIAVAVSNVRALLAESQQCSADKDTQDGVTNVTFFIEEEVKVGDEDENDIDDIDIGFDPPDVSPF
jgi:hypothetical protein